MARTTDPVCKMCRREGIKLYLKGSRCDSPKCAIERRNIAPGMHGYRRGKLSEYGIRLREKQKLKRFYGVLERQFRRYFELASRAPQNTGEELLSIMERRLDNVVHRLGWAPSRAAARQLVTHGNVTVNGKFCNIPSLILKVGDVVRVKKNDGALTLVRLFMQQSPPPVPAYLIATLAEGDIPEGTLRSKPTRDDVDPRIQGYVQEQLVIEFCSR
jgi:small subunit ribosomal protein S4